MRTIISYDIASDKKRYRVARKLLDRARRVQRSVFEAADLDLATYLRLRSDLEGLVDPTTDSLRYYRSCATCAARTEHFGAGPGYVQAPPAFDIIDGKQGR